MQYWNEQAVTEVSDDYGLMDNLRQIREMEEDEEALLYARYALRWQNDNHEKDLEEEEDYDEDEDIDDEDLDVDVDDEDEEDDHN